MNRSCFVACVLFVAACSSGGASSSSPTGGAPGTSDPSTPGGGGGGDKDGPAPPPPPNGVCATEAQGTTADGDPVTRCTSLHAGHPYIHLPDDEVNGNKAKLFVGVTMTYSKISVVDRRGTTYDVVDDAGAAIAIDPVRLTLVKEGAPATVTKGLRMPSNRNAYLVYRVEGETGAGTDFDRRPTKTIHLTSAHPAVLLEPHAIDGRFGAWEGEVARRRPDGMWDWASRVRFRASFTKTKALAPITETTHDSKPLADGGRESLVGAIENWSTPVRASDGTCLPAFATMGDQDPFYGAPSGEIALQRVLGMHVSMTEENMVLTYPATPGLAADGMDGMTPWTARGIIRVDPDKLADDLEVIPHGNPFGHKLQMHRVTSGGGGC